jgi:ribosomal subunit interface protein
MNISFKATNMELTNDITDYATKRVESLEKVLRRFDAPYESIIFEIEVEKITNQQTGDIFRAEVNISIPGEQLIRVEDTQSEIFASLDEVRETLFRTIRNEKDKQDTLIRKGEEEIKDVKKQI